MDPEPAHLREGVGYAAPTPKDAGVEHFWYLYGPFASGKCKVVENPTCPPAFDTCVVHTPEVDCPAGSSGHTGTITQELGGAACTLHFEEHGDASCPEGRLCSPPRVFERALTVSCPNPVASP